MSDLPPVVPILLELLSIPSVTGAERAICDHVEATIKRAVERGQKLKWARLGDALVVQGPRQKERMHMVMLGHLDTVPEVEGARPRLEDDRIIGRGAVDMKAGLAVMIGIIEGLDLVEAQCDLTLVFYPAEEGPYEANGLANLLHHGHVPLDADLYILLEPTHGQLQLGCLGSISADVTFFGTSAHAARPWLGRNAITKSGRWLLAMDRRKPLPVDRQGLVFRETFQVTLASGGVANNVVPDEFVCRVNYRFAPGRSVDQAVRQLQKATRHADMFKIVDSCPAAKPCIKNPLLDWMREGMRLSVHAKQAWTDVARLTAAGLDAANYGPGDPELAHQDDEWIQVKDLNRYYRKMGNFLTRGADEK